MSIKRKVRRLIDLHKLWWAADRMTAVELRLSALEQSANHLKLTHERAVLEVGARLESAVNQINARIDAASARIDIESARIHAESARIDAEGARIDAEGARTDARIDAESARISAENERTNVASARIDAESARITDTMNVAQSVRGELETLKSSLEVPQEMVDEFFDWKAQNPVPAHPLVTVIVVTYNRSGLLTERCIPSILGQTYDNLELIVFGDGCTDDTEQLVRQIKDPRLRFNNLPERGRYPADPIRRWMVAGTTPGNEAISLARGDFITHLDDDDEYLPDRLEKLVKFAVDNQCDFVWHPFWWEQSNGVWIINHAVEIAHGQITNGSVLYRGWFKKVLANMDAHRLMEPGDWNRFRRIKYIGPVAKRYPEPLLRHYRERNRPDTS